MTSPLEYTEEDKAALGSGNFTLALEEAALDADDFLTSGDLTIEQIHNLSTSPKIGGGGSNNSLATTTNTVVPPTSLDDHGLADLRTASPTASTSSRSSQRDTLPSSSGPTVSPLPRVSKSSATSSGAAAAARSPSPQKQTPRSDSFGGLSQDAKKPRKASGGLPRVAMLAKPPPPKKEIPSRASPPPFRVGGPSTLATATPSSLLSSSRSPPPPSRAASTTPATRTAGGRVVSRTNTTTSNAVNRTSSDGGGAVGAGGALRSATMPAPRRTSTTSAGSTDSRPGSSTAIPAGATGAGVSLRTPREGVAASPRVLSGSTTAAGTAIRGSSSPTRIPAPSPRGAVSPNKPGKTDIPRPKVTAATALSGVAAAAVVGATASDKAEVRTPRHEDLEDFLDELEAVKKELGLAEGKEAEVEADAVAGAVAADTAAEHGDNSETQQQEMGAAAAAAAAAAEPQVAEEDTTPIINKKNADVTNTQDMPELSLVDHGAAANEGADSEVTQPVAVDEAKVAADVAALAEPTTLDPMAQKPLSISEYGDGDAKGKVKSKKLCCAVM